MARQTQAQTWNRAKNKFCKPRAQWPGGKLDTHSNFTRRQRCTPSQECVPRNGVRGKRPMDLGGAKRSRSPSDASPGAFCLLCRHGQSRSPPAGGEIPQQETKPLYHRPLIRPSVRTGAPSPQGEGLWAATPAPTANQEAVSSFRRGRTLAGPQMYAARPGGRALQRSTSCHLLGQAGRGIEAAVVKIFANPGPSGPAGV